MLWRFGVFFYTKVFVQLDFSFPLDYFFGKAGYFDLLRKTSLTVPMYADRLVLLVFGALSPASIKAKALSRKA